MFFIITCIYKKIIYKKMRSAGSYFAERPLRLAEQNMVLHGSIFLYNNISYGNRKINLLYYIYGNIIF